MPGLLWASWGLSCMLTVNRRPCFCFLLPPYSLSLEYLKGVLSVGGKSKDFPIGHFVIRGFVLAASPGTLRVKVGGWILSKVHWAGSLPRLSQLHPVFVLLITIFLKCKSACSPQWPYTPHVAATMSPSHLQPCQTPCTGSPSQEAFSLSPSRSHKT